MIRIRKAGFKSLRTFCRAPAVLAGLAAMGLAACDGGGKNAWRGEAPAPASERPAQFVAGYLKPPRVTGVKTEGGLTLTGEAAPDASVRLGAPTGETLMGRADAQGRWRLSPPRASDVRLFGLSMTKAGRTVQAEGYVMVTPEGAVALLRAGSGAYRLAPPSPSPRILAIDYDQSGGAVVSGVAAPGAGLGMRIDRAPRGEGKADDHGRFAFSLSQPLGAGPHGVQVAGEGGEQLVMIDASAPAPLKTGPMRTLRTASGWRVDWMTPGGGVQSTLILADGR